nr:OR9 [Hycleus phaleratus]AWT23311.1 OR16 [Hycleus phaleratus]
MEMKIVSIFTIINTTVAMAVGFAVLIFNRYDYTTFLPIKYFVDYHPEYSGIFANIYKGSFTFAVTFLMTPHAYQVVYYTQHFKYQFWMLIDLIDDIMRGEISHILPSRLIEDHEYQQQIKLNLIGFVKRHQELLM